MIPDLKGLFVALVLFGVLLGMASYAGFNFARRHVSISFSMTRKP